jgi:hypothetical protein
MERPNSSASFLYHEKDRLVWGEYSGGSIVKGMLLATKAADGSLDMRYQHVNSNGELMTGVCASTVEVLADGRYRLQERWRWTCGDSSTGESVLEQAPGDAQFVSETRGAGRHRLRPVLQLVRQP